MKDLIIIARGEDLITQVTDLNGYTYFLRIGPAEDLFIMPEGTDEWKRGLGVFPDRLKFIEATTRTEIDEDGFVNGFNEQGTRTLHLVRNQVREGMMLTWAGGGRSGIICKSETITIDSEEDTHEEETCSV
jgi:hypothetical protein